MIWDRLGIMEDNNMAKKKSPARLEFEWVINELACSRCGLKGEATPDEITYWFMDYSGATQFQGLVKNAYPTVDFRSVGARSEGVRVIISSPR